MELSMILCVVAAWCGSARLVEGYFGGLLGNILQRATRSDDSSQTSAQGAFLQDGATFEYIVVGAGAAGCAVAARLALAGRRVLLVEAGGDQPLFSKIPGAGPALMGSSIDYFYETISNNMSCLAFQKQQCHFSRGRVLGGSTSINYMIYTRGNPRDFDDLGQPGWTWDDMKPYFLKYEGLQELSKLPDSSIPYHNTTGIMKLQYFADPQNPWHSRIIQAFSMLNFPYNPDVNAESQIGVTQSIGYVYKNERMSTARAYLGDKDVKKVLNVSKHTKCTGVIIDDDNVARGITVVHGLLNKKLTLYATKEVILSAGTIETPHLLMLSGIGPADHLREFDIPVVADLPVGDDMVDHVLPLLFLRVDKGTGVGEDLVAAANKANQLVELLFLRSGPLTSNGLTDVTGFVNTNCYDFENHTLRSDGSDCEIPTLQLIHAYIDRYIVSLGRGLFQKATGLGDAVVDQLAEVSRDHALLVVSPVVLRPHSRGRVRLASPDPLEPPAIFPNFVADERDLEEMVRAIRIVEHLEETPLFRKNNATIVRLKFPGCPSESSDRAGYRRCYARQMTQSCFHAAGSARVGRVLDARLRVRGVRRLRVADLSALPRPPRANTAAVAIAIGERLADFILNK